MRLFHLLLTGLVLLAAPACHPPEEAKTLANPVQQAGGAEAYYALLASYCDRAEIAADGQAAARPLAARDTMRFGQRTRFISGMDPRRTQQYVRWFLQQQHLDTSVVGPNGFTPQVPAVGAPRAFALCQGRLRAVLFTNADTARPAINNFLTLSRPLALCSGQQLVYYEMGRERRKMMAGVMLLVVEPTGRRRMVAESLLWIN